VSAGVPAPFALIKPRRPRATHHRVAEGEAWPLGAAPDRHGVNFAVHSAQAERVELCLFAADGRTEVERMVLPGFTHGVWHGYVHGLRPGQLYGLRVHGLHEPAAGWRFNPALLLLDPYARAIDRPLVSAPALFAYPLGHEDQDLAMNADDNGALAPKCRVVRGAFDWGDDEPPRVPPQDTVFYEVHVKGFTQAMPGVPSELRGTYAGLASPPALQHLRDLGITSVELLPVQAFIDDGFLQDAGLTNYWGYNTVAFFAPEPRYGGPDPVTEFKAMVKALHAAGIEVILDVVYNHTGEGNHLGPTLSLKGIDNPGYYRLAEEARYYTDHTGTGNTVDTSSPPALRLVLDSLRYWVTDMHVDGFRFDLASALGRDALGRFDHRSPFFAALAQDPVLARVKLVAEPWDLGPDGYQVGGFPAGWMEWNGRYRDAVRDYWRNTDGSLPEFSAALCGGADMYRPRRRPPWTSVNLVTVHDGFTLHDLVSYDSKHNEANGEGNADGEAHNRSWNCGAEGPSEDPSVQALRARQCRNFLTTLFVSLGAPLLLGGDEIGRTQGGNNNAYCQDNEISWFDWGRAGEYAALHGFVRSLIQLRHELAVLRPRAWPSEGADGAGACPAIEWHSVWGQPMTAEEWNNPQVRCVAAVIDGSDDEDAVLLLFNATPEEAMFTLPKEAPEREWVVRIDTRTSEVPPPDEGPVASGAHWTLEAFSMAVLTARAWGAA
jgi:isoamylase